MIPVVSDVVGNHPGRDIDNPVAGNPHIFVRTNRSRWFAVAKLTETTLVQASECKGRIMSPRCGNQRLQPFEKLRRGWAGGKEMWMLQPTDRKKRRLPCP